MNVVTMRIEKVMAASTVLIQTLSSMTAKALSVTITHTDVHCLLSTTHSMSFCMNGMQVEVDVDILISIKFFGEIVRALRTE